MKASAKHPRRGPYGRFTLLAGAGIAAFLGSLVPTFATWEPFDGGQTRVSGRSEVDYGWTQPQEFFAERSYKVSRSVADYDRPYEIIVVGDSFSGRPVFNQWLDYFAEQTGADILCIWSGRANDVLALTRNPHFQAHPPRLVIFESVERNVIQRLGQVRTSTSRGAPAQTIQAPPLVVAPRHAAKVERSRPTEMGVMQRIQEVAATTQTRLGLRLEGDRVQVVPLDSPQPLFSSKRSDELLVLGLDQPKLGITPKQVARAAEGLRALRQKVQANRQTRFAFVTLPDKSSIYAPYAASPEGTTPNLIGQLAAHEPFLRFDEMFAERLRQGHVDLYLPDDSHTGSEGSRRVADAVTQSLIQDGTFVTAP